MLKVSNSAILCWFIAAMDGEALHSSALLIVVVGDWIFNIILLNQLCYYRDRTAQLTSLAQVIHCQLSLLSFFNLNFTQNINSRIVFIFVLNICNFNIQVLLDPFYRTIEGFFALVNKEWCAFGPKFEHRTNRHDSHKEASPVFLQFLDGVWQILQQYPSAFEFTSAFLVVFAQAAYSGYFITFRGNSEDERNFMMRRVAPLEDMPLSELQHSTVFFYIYMLLRCEVFASLLVNTFYQPPIAARSSVQYLRPRTGISDLSVWRDGLVGFNRQGGDVAVAAQTPSLQECIAVSSNIGTR